MPKSVLSSAMALECVTGIPMFNRNIVVLLIAMPLAMTSAPVLIFIGSLLGEQLAPQERFATLPVALVIIGTAFGAIPAARLMKSKGRRRGFVVAQCMAILASVGCMGATLLTSFTLLLASAFTFGASIAFIQQARFAALENVKRPSDAPKILSCLMLTGVVGGLLGPELAFLSKNLFRQAYMGSFFVVAGLQGLALLVLWHYRDLPSDPSNEPTSGSRQLSTVLRSPNVVLAILAGAVGYGVMSFVMTATPNSMHHIYHHELSATKWVIQSHIAAMFLPSIFSGFLISRWGTTPLIIAGILLYGACLAFGLSGLHMHNFLLALIALGIGWNFLFISSTMLLSQSCRKSEQHSLQAANDFLIFGVQALASICAGWVLYAVGWRWVLWLNLPLLALLCVVLAWKIWSNRGLARRDSTA